jgi:membrane protease YdiL (CAAX protease family)
VTEIFEDEDEAGGDPAPRIPWLRRELVAPWLEIVLVTAVIIGFSTLASSLQAWYGSSRNYMALLLTDSRMIRTIAMESAILGLLFVHLNWRGWKRADLRITPTWGSSGFALLLMLGMIAANFVTVFIGFMIFFALRPHNMSVAAFVASVGPHMKLHSVNVSWFAILPAMVFNGFFEEITCMGYVFNQFAAKRGPMFALILTILLRMSCHTYQGAIHALGIGAAFVVSGLVYWWTRNLWILILAHIILDLFSTGLIKMIFG